MVGSVIQLLVVIAIVGLIAWAIVYFIPMPPKFATAIYVVAGVACLLIILSMFTGGPGLKLGFG